MRRANAILLSGKNILLLHLTFYKLLKSLSQSHCAHSLYKTRFWAVYSYSPYLNLTWECFRCLYHVQLQNVWFCDVLMRPVSSGPRLRFHFRWGGAFTRREEATRPARKKKRKERRAILQTTRLVLLLSVAVKNSTECYFNTTTEHWISSGTIRLCLVIFNYFFSFFFFLPARVHLHPGGTVVVTPQIPRTAAARINNNKRAQRLNQAPVLRWTSPPWRVSVFLGADTFTGWSSGSMNQQIKPHLKL